MAEELLDAVKTLKLLRADIFELDFEKISNDGRTALISASRADPQIPHYPRPHHPHPHPRKKRKRK